MSRYLEDAARVLRKAEEITGSVEHRIKIAEGFATLAAIDKGLLPAGITQELIETIVRKNS